LAKCRVNFGVLTFLACGFPIIELQTC